MDFPLEPDFFSEAVLERREAIADPGVEGFVPGVVGDRGDLGDPDAEVRTLRILPEGDHANV